MTEKLQSPIKLLTKRENQIIALLASGLTNRQISRTLAIAEGTVRTHISRIYIKLHVESRLTCALLWHGHRVPRHPAVEAHSQPE